MTNPTSSVSGVEVELLIEKVVFGGEGLARRQGQVYLVEGALSGEKVLARITEEKKNFSRASILKILQTSPHRRDPLCRYAVNCGGCQYQHVTYSEELRLKALQLEEILQGLSLEKPFKISPVTPSPDEWSYRNSVTLHPIFLKKKKGAKLGYIGKDNTSKIPIQECPLLDTRLQTIFEKEYSLKPEIDKVTFKVSEGGQIVSDGNEVFFRVKLGEESFLSNSRGFFQNNLKAASLLVEKVKQWTEAMAPSIFFDLCAGVGIFSILCARSVKKVIAIEESPVSVQALRMNREEKKISQLEIIEGRVEKTFPAAWEKFKEENALVLLDPPRQGISESLARFLSKKQGIGGLIYVSCDPVTLTRDLKIILSGGAWQLGEVAPFDFFPKTKHLEVVVFLTPVL